MTFSPASTWVNALVLAGMLFALQMERVKEALAHEGIPLALFYEVAGSIVYACGIRFVSEN